MYLNIIPLTKGLGPTLINLKSLVKNICHYMSVLHQILRNYEQYSNMASSELADQFSLWWAYRQLEDYDGFQGSTPLQLQLRRHSTTPGKQY
jgi:hypothetical protein